MSNELFYYRGFKIKRIKKDKWEIYDATGAYVTTDNNYTELRYIKYKIDEIISNNYKRR